MDSDPSGTVSRLTFTLYSREGCCLCVEMYQALSTMNLAQPFTIDVVDIDNDTDLVKHYAGRIPVLVLEGNELCECHLDPQAITDYLNAKKTN